MRYLIDPFKVTDFNRPDDQLQAFWLFAILVAGKNAKVQAQKLAEFLEPMPQGEADDGYDPFNWILALDWVGSLEAEVRAHKLGQYSRIVPAFRQSLDLDLREDDVHDFEKVYGVGPKTARFFLLHSREDQDFAVLDTHILRWMEEELKMDVPRATPTGDRYLQLEESYLEAAVARGMTPADLDLHIWSKYTKNVA